MSNPPPQNLTAIPGDTIVTLRWDPPIYPQTIAKYKVTVFDGSRNIFTDLSSNSPKVIMNLTNNKTYSFSVETGSSKADSVIATPRSSAAGKYIIYGIILGIICALFLSGGLLGSSIAMNDNIHHDLFIRFTLGLIAIPLGILYFFYGVYRRLKGNPIPYFGMYPLFKPSGWSVLDILFEFMHHVDDPSSNYMAHVIYKIGTGTQKVNEDTIDAGLNKAKQKEPPS